MNSPRRHSDLFGADSSDFIIRRRLPGSWQLICLFAVCYLLIFLSMHFATQIGGVLTFCIVLFGVLGPMCWYILYFAQHNRDMLMATEFQNALFSAAARLKSKFCIIVKQDGTIVYHDRNFESVFPETSNRGMLMIDKLFNAKNIAPMEADKIYKALGDGRADTVFIDIPEENEIRRIIITVDPLPRPSGFFILRGRDYVAKKYEQKVGGSDDKLASVDPKNVATIAHILHTLPFGIYSSDADGNLLFANYKLESMLGYDQHEIANRKLTLYDLIPQTNTPAVEHLLLRDCEGDIYFTTRGGKQITLHVKQEITKDANGGVIGNVSIVSPAKGAGGAPVTGGNFDSGGGKPSPVDGRSETPSLLSGRTF